MAGCYKPPTITGIDVSHLSKLLVGPFHMKSQENPQFWRYQIRKNPPLFESYCLRCNAFVAASESQLNLALVELLHALRCRREPVEAENLTTDKHG